MTGLNKVFLLGHIGADPEVRSTATGKDIVFVNIATPRSRRLPDGGWAQDTDWHRLTFFDSNATFIANYAKKGAVLSVEAALRPKRWVDANGKTHYGIDIVVSHISYLGRPKTADVGPRFISPDPQPLDLQEQWTPEEDPQSQWSPDDRPPPHEDEDAPAGDPHAD